MANGTNFDDSIEISKGSYNITFALYDLGRYFVIRPVVGTIINLETTGTTDTYINLYDAAKTRLQFDDNSGTNKNAKISFTAVDSVYYIRVSNYPATSGNEYTTLVVTEGAQAATGNSLNDAIPLSPNTSHFINFSPTKKDVYYVIKPSVGTEFELETTGSLDTYLHLYNSNKSQIAYNDDGGSGSNAKISYTVTASNTTFYIRVRPYSSNVTSSMSTTFHYREIPPQAGTGGFDDAINVTLNQTERISLVESKPVYLKIGTGELISDEDYAFDFTNENYSYTAKVEIYNSSRTLLYSSNGFQTQSYLQSSLKRYTNNGQDFFYMKITGQGTTRRAWTVKSFLAKRITSVTLSTSSVTFRGTTPVKFSINVTPTDAYDVNNIYIESVDVADYLTYEREIDNGTIHFTIYNSSRYYAPVIEAYVSGVSGRQSYPNRPRITSTYEDVHNFSQGEGTYENPYLISTKEELETIGNAPWFSYRQINDIDLTGVNWNPIGRLSYSDGAYKGASFVGNYDGGNFKIIGLTSELFSEIRPMYYDQEIHKPSIIENIVFQSPRIIKDHYACTLSWYVYNANIINCHVVDAQLQATYVGGIGGHFSMDGNYTVEINGCSFEGNIKGDKYVGGIAYQVFGYSAVRNCKSKGNFSYIDSSSWSYMGGLLGYVSMRENSIIENCHFEGTISSTNYAGGIVAYCSGVGTLKDCTSKGDIKAISADYSNYVGGITAHFSAYGNLSQIVNCHSTGNIESTYYAGGLVGYVSSGDRIIDCSSNGNVKGEGYTGGLIGYYSAYDVEYSLIERCYSVGDVTSTDNGNNGSYFGGFIGYLSRGKLKNCYSQGLVRGRNIVGGFVGSAYLYDNLENVYCQSEKVESFYEYSQIGAMFGHCGFNDSNHGIKNSFIIVDEVKTLDATGGYNVGNVSGYMSDSTPIENLFILDTLKIQDNHKQQITSTVTKEQAKQQATYTNVGWDFASMWVIQEGVSYPVFKLVEFAVYLKNKGTWKEAQAMYSKVKGKWQQITAINVKNKGKWQ